KVPTSSLAPRQTQEISITANLDSGALPSTFDNNRPANSQAKTSITAFDPLAESRPLDVYSVKTADNALGYRVLADGAELAGVTPGTFTEVGTGTLTFDTNGALLDAQTPDLTIDFAGGATPGQVITMDFGDDIANDGATGLAGTTQFAAASAVSSQS